MLLEYCYHVYPTYKLDIHDNNSPIPCKLFGIPKCALLIVHLNHGSKDSLMMTRMSRNMSL